MYKILLECSADLKASRLAARRTCASRGSNKDSAHLEAVEMATTARGYAVDARAYRMTERIFEFCIRVAYYVSHIGCAWQALTHSRFGKIVSDQQKEVQDLSRAFQALDARIASKEELAVEQSVLDWVCDYNYQAQHHRAYRLHCDNTSSWILDHPLFMHWRESRDPVEISIGILGGKANSYRVLTTITEYVGAKAPLRKLPTITTSTSRS